jgi:hypothetical protein
MRGDVLKGKTKKDGEISNDDHEKRIIADSTSKSRKWLTADI